MRSKKDKLKKFFILIYFVFQYSLFHVSMVGWLVNNNDTSVTIIHKETLKKKKYTLYKNYQRLISFGGLKSMGWVSGVALSSSFHIFIVLSASHVTNLVPLRSNDIA